MKNKIVIVIYSLTLFFALFSFQPIGGHTESAGLPPEDQLDNVEMLQQPLDGIDAAIETAITEKVMPGAVVLG